MAENIYVNDNEDFVYTDREILTVELACDHKRLLRLGL